LILFTCVVYPSFLSNEMIKDGIHDTFYMSTSVLKKDNFPLFFCLGLASTFIYMNDSTMASKLQSDALKDLEPLGNFMGHPLIIVPLFSATYTYGYFMDTSYKKPSFLTLKSVIISNVIVHSLKLSFHRYRPKTNQGTSSFDGPSLSLNDDTLSFPSSHSATAFSVATVFSELYPSTSVISYALASFVAWSRIQSRNHFPSDVFVGALIGHFTAKTVIGLNHHTPSMSLIPYASRNSLAVLLQYRF